MKTYDNNKEMMPYMSAFGHTCTVTIGGDNSLWLRQLNLQIDWFNICCEDLIIPPVPINPELSREFSLQKGFLPIPRGYAIYTQEIK